MRHFLTNATSALGRLAVFAAAMVLLSFSSSYAGNSFSDATGQGEVTDGQEFYIAIPHCWRMQTDDVVPGQKPYEAWVSSKVSTMVTMVNKFNGINMSFPVSPGKTTIIPLPENLMSLESEVAVPYGIVLTSNDPISVTVAMNWRSSGAVYKALPAEMLGKKYAVLSLYQDKTDVNKPGQIVIVATKDETTVRWKYPSNVKAKTDKETFSVTLQQGETYLIELVQKDAYHQNTLADLTGTIVTADKPIAVISGHTKGAMSRYEDVFFGLSAEMSRTAQVEMMYPIEMAGTEFMTLPRLVANRPVHKWPDDHGDMIRFVAVENGTIVYQMRQDGTSPKQISTPLQAGQFYELTNMEDAAYYTSNKPMVVGQYLKAWMMHAYERKGENPLGHVSGGAGEFFNVTPVNAWPSYAQFYSPKKNANYVNITFRTEDINTIKFDGKSLQTVFGSKIKKYAGTEFSYASKEISEGDHSIEGGKFAAYAYGNWDDLVYPNRGNYAYGYPVGVNFAIKCDDELKMSGDPQCGNVKGIAQVGPDGSDCAGLLYVRMMGAESNNYKFSTPKTFMPGDKLTTFTLDVVDPTKPAKAVVKAVSRSGRYLTRTYEYTPEELTFAPTSINFGTLPLGDKLCRTITLTNPSATSPTTVMSLRIKLAQKEFTISPAGFPITIPPNSSKDVEVCATALERKSVTVVDTVIAVLGCFEMPISELKVRTEKPKVFIQDAAFREVPVNTERTKDVEIRNVGTVDVTLTEVTWPDHVHFLRTENLNFPITLKADGVHTFQVVYNPGATTGVEDKTRAVFTANTDEIKVYSDWTGTGINAGPFITGYDWNERRVLDNFAGVTEYPFTVTYGNSEKSAALENVTIKVIGADAPYFTADLITVPSRLSAGEDNKTLAVSFKPTYLPGTRDAERAYTLQLEMKGTFNGVEKTATAELKGIGVQPHVALTPKIDFGTFKVNESKSENAVLTSNGTMKLTLMNKIKGFSIDGPDAARFVIDPAFLAQNPYGTPVSNIVGNNTIAIPVIFTAENAARTAPYTATLHIETDAPENPTTELVAVVVETGKPAVKTTDVELKQYITLTKDGKVEIENTGEVDVTITEIKAPQGSFYWKILSNTPMPKTLKVGEVLALDVQYSPINVFLDAQNQVVKDIATIEYVTSIGSYISTLTGTPDQIVSLVKVGRAGNNGAWLSEYSTVAGETTEYIDINLTNNEVENLDRADISKFTMTVNYLAELVEPIIATVEPSAFTQGNGWTIDMSNTKIVGPGKMIVTMSGPTPLRGEGSLFRFKMNAYLGTELNSIIGCNMDILDPVKKGYVLVNNRPGKVLVDLNCSKEIRRVHISDNTYTLKAGTPNPVVAHGTIDYSIGLDGQTSVEIYNVMGQKVATLVDQFQRSGQYQIAFDTDALQLTSGTYTCKIVSGPYTETTQLVITK
jgi:hypothetical protein